jgi:hypothetical protein
MKARIKATGEVIEVERVGVCSNIWALKEDATVTFENDELDVNTEPDYWEKLKHQYAGMAMQSLMPSFERMRQDWINGELEDGHSITREEANIVLKDHAEAAADVAKVFATALVNKLKEEK